MVINRRSVRYCALMPDKVNTIRRAAVNGVRCLARPSKRDSLGLGEVVESGAPEFLEDPVDAGRLFTRHYGSRERLSRLSGTLLPRRTRAHLESPPSSGRGNLVLSIAEGALGEDLVCQRSPVEPGQRRTGTLHPRYVDGAQKPSTALKLRTSLLVLYRRRGRHRRGRTRQMLRPIGMSVARGLFQDHH